MTIAVIGATGFVGSAIVHEALQRGHTVRGIARGIGQATIAHERLQKIPQDVSDIAGLAKALEGADIVISAFGAGLHHPDIYHAFTQGARAIETAVERSGVKRLIVIGGAGTLEVTPGLQLIDSPLFPEEYRAIGNAIRDYYYHLRENTALDWAFFSPAIEVHPDAASGRTGIFRLGTDQVVFDAAQRSRLSVEDIAVAIVDEAEQNRFVQKRFTAAY